MMTYQKNTNKNTTETTADLITHIFQPYYNYMVFIRMTKRQSIKYTSSYIQSTKAYNQKQSHVHITNKIIKNCLVN